MRSKYPINARIRTLAGSTFIAVSALSSWAKDPIVKTGPCPPLEREPFAMDARFDERFIGGNPLNIFLKDPAKHGTIQKPLPPEQSINGHEVPSGLKVETWTTENEASAKTVALQAFTFDERGRMWAVETFDYPNNISDPFHGNDRVVILEDTDGDGVADSLKVFVSGLNIAQAIEIVPQGVVVGVPPYLVLFEDKDGDDVADDPTGKILYSGFYNHADTHGTIHSLHWGADNWLYGMGFMQDKVGGVTMAQNGMWRARTDTTRFEVIGYTPGGSAGMGIMEDGQLFASSANVNHSQHAAIPGPILASISSYGQGIAYRTLDLVQGDWRGSFTAATDHEIYTARLLPKAYWNRAAFVTEGTGHLVNMDFLQPKGSSWSAMRDSTAPNLFASTDAWTAPIRVKTGPDGAVWVLDWYIYILLHNGIDCAPYGGCPGGAWPHALRNRTRQRIYRILPADKPADPVLNLTNASLEQLVSTFSNSNLHWRLMAQRLIFRKHNNSADKAKLESLLGDILSKSRSVDEVGLDPMVIHSLWTAHELGFFSNASKWDPILKALMHHPAPGVRRNVVLALPSSAASVAAIKEVGLSADKDPHVRLAVLIALARMPTGNPVPVYADHRNLDDLSKSAFSRAGSNVIESATVLREPILDAAMPPLSARPGFAARPDIQGLRFRFLAGGSLEPEADGRLEPGVLRIFDMQGKLSSEATFDGRAWSFHPSDMRGSLRFYAYAGNRGLRLEGRLPPMPLM